MEIESTTLWDFPRQNYGDTPHGNNKYNGVTPALVFGIYYNDTQKRAIWLLIRCVEAEQQLM